MLLRLHTSGVVKRFWALYVVDMILAATPDRTPAAILLVHLPVALLHCKTAAAGEGTTPGPGTARGAGKAVEHLCNRSKCHSVSKARSHMRASSERWNSSHRPWMREKYSAPAAAEPGGSAATAARGSTAAATTGAPTEADKEEARLDDFSCKDRELCSSMFRKGRRSPVKRAVYRVAEREQNGCVFLAGCLVAGLECPKRVCLRHTAKAFFRFHTYLYIYIHISMYVYTCDREKRLHVCVVNPVSVDVYVRTYTYLPVLEDFEGAWCP